jgi:outer membrane lipoprotein-sorting protein
MTHDEKSVDRLLRSLQPPRFQNRAHQALLRERIAASAADSPDLGKMEKLKMMTGSFKSQWRWAVAAATAALVALCFWGVAGSGSSKAYAQAVRKLREAQKMSMVATINDGTSTPLRVELAFKAPSIIRKVQDQMVAIVDVASGKGIAIFPGQKRYLEMRIDLTSQTAGMDNLVTEFRSFPLAADKKLGLKTIRGRVAQGFCVNSGGGYVETWIDPVTGDPLQIDIRMQKDAGMTLSMTDIKLDPPLDDALLSGATGRLQGAGHARRQDPAQRA